MSLVHLMLLMFPEPNTRYPMVLIKYLNFALIRSKPELHARNQNFFHCCFHRTHVPHHGLCKLNKQCVMGYLKRFNLDIFEQSMFNVT